MIVTPFAGRPAAAVRQALLSHGWEGDSSRDAAAALEPWTCVVTGLADQAVEALLRVAPTFGLDLLTGEGLVILAGTRSRLSAMARSWTLPPELAEMAVRVGQTLPADDPPFWRVRSGPVALQPGPVLVSGRWPGARGQWDVGTGEYVEANADSPPPEALTQAQAEGLGLLLLVRDPHTALEQLAAGLDAAALAGVDPEQIAVDSGWAPGTGGPDLALVRALGRPIVCTSDDPVTVALARTRGASLFRTRHPEAVTRAVRAADAAGV